jgi:hypothetical protein
MLKFFAKAVLTAVVAGGLVGGVARADSFLPPETTGKKPYTPPSQSDKKPVQVTTPTQYDKKPTPPSQYDKKPTPQQQYTPPSQYDKKPVVPPPAPPKKY